MSNDTVRHDANGTCWHLHNVPCHDERRRRGIDVPDCSCCGLSLGSAVAWFDDDFIDRSFRALHEHCFASYDDNVRYLANKGNNESQG